MENIKSLDVPKFVLEHYDMFMDNRMTIQSKGTDKILLIYSWIVFTPKEVTEFTPRIANFYSKHKVTIMNDNVMNISYEDAIYLRKKEMPLLLYTGGDYYMDEYCEKMVNNKIKDIVSDITSGKEINVPLIFTIGNRIYFDYFKNNF